MSARLRLGANFWQGVYTVDFTLAEVRRRSRHLAALLAARGWSCLVAHDTRFMSGLFARDIYATLTAQGVPAILASSPMPLPVLFYALDEERATCALVVSARNRAYWYNGLVLIAPNAPELVLDAGNEPPIDLPFPSPPDVSSQPASSDFSSDLRTAYFAMLAEKVDLELIRRATLTIFVDPMNGSTAGYLSGIISEGVQTRAIEINRETDPLFGKITPLPAEGGLNRLRKLVRESDSHVGLAFSADGTALGVVDKNGDMLDPLEVVLLLAAYLSRQHRKKGLVVAPPPSPSSPMASQLAGLSNWESAAGLKIEITADASARINELLKNDRPNLLVGLTAGGELTVGTASPHPDALLAGLLLVEQIARNGGNLRALLDELRGHLARN